MPEGPSIVILKEQASRFIGQKVLAVSGNAKIDKERALGAKVIELRSWGKQFLICFETFTFRIHLLLFGSYRINEERSAAPRLSLQFKNGVLNFYACSVRLLDESLDDIYDWSADVMSETWDPAAARTKLREHPERLACDVLLDQEIFAGSGNIIKNEVLFRTRIHPLSIVGSLSARKRNELIREVRGYSFDFLEWKKAYVLRKHWQVHNKQICPRCNIPLSKGRLGKFARRSFFCEKCQKLYDRTQPERDVSMSIRRV